MLVDDTKRMLECAKIEDCVGARYWLDTTQHGSGLNSEDTAKIIQCVKNSKRKSVQQAVETTQ